MGEREWRVWKIGRWRWGYAAKSGRHEVKRGERSSRRRAEHQARAIVKEYHQVQGVLNA